MKISNWCILFSVLFCGMILYTDLRFRYTMEAQYTMEEYNRIFDRAAEDALTDQLQEEYWDGSLKIDEEKVQNRFFEQTAYVLDLTGETEKENLKELVLLRKLVNEKGKSLSVASFSSSDSFHSIARSSSAKSVSYRFPSFSLIYLISSRRFSRICSNSSTPAVSR